MDHFLGKETVQNIMALRVAKAHCERFWTLPRLQFTLDQFKGATSPGQRRGQQCLIAANTISGSLIALS
jgi:hypothetical protein